MKLRTPRLGRRALAVAAATALAIPLAMSTQGTAVTGQRAVAHGANGKSVRTRTTAYGRMSRLGHGAGEPTLGFTRSGKLFYTASSGCVTSCAPAPQMTETVAPGGRAIYMTADKGKTWQNVSPGDPSTGVSPHVFSLDPYLYVDSTPDGNRVFDVDLTLACAELSYSDDEGKSWLTNPVACGEPVNDHQTVFTGKPVTSPTVGYPKIVYYCFNHPAFTKCSKSLNGGLTFMPTAQISNPTCSGLNGHGITDAKGTIYIPLASSCNKPKLAISKDEGNTWKVIDVAEDGTAEGDPSVAIDKNGALYYLWIDQENRLPHLVTSRNSGASWSKPVVVSPRGVAAANLATLDVGAPGKVAIAYYGTTGDPDDVQTGWNGYIAAGVNVLTSPVFYTATINDPRQPLKVNKCRGRCGRVLDFIDVEIAPDGTPWGAYVDACLATCEKTRKETLADNEGVVGTLVGAPSLVK